MRIIDSMAPVGHGHGRRQDHLPRRRLRRQEPVLTPSTPEEEKLDFLLLLYRIFAEYMSIRLRVTNEELIAAKKKIKHLISKL